MTSNCNLSDILNYIDRQFMRLEAAAHEIHVTAIMAACRIAADGDEVLNSKLVAACVNAGLDTSDLKGDAFAYRLQRVIGGAL